MKALTVKDARQRLSGVIRDAESGRATIITRHGKPVAKIVPVSKMRPKFPDLEEFRKSIKPRGKTLTETLLALRDEERY